ncbi:MAG TPA: PAS domain S-box protein [Gemmatimonadales bacterium]|nr:PAS domain S-box protein [Gemmatimonadales bacterium]
MMLPRPEGLGPVDPALLSAILESMGDALLVMDHEWRFTYLNRAAEEFLERPRETLLGRNAWEEFAPAVGGPSYQAYHRALETGQPQQALEYYAPLDRWFEIGAFPTPDLIVVHFRDISDAQRAAEALRRSATDLAQAQAQAQAGVGSWRRDLATGQAVWSDEMLRMFGRDPAGPAPDRDEVLDLVHPDDRNRVRHVFQQAAVTGETWSEAVRVRVPGRGERLILARIEGVRGPDGRLVAQRGTAQDVTERRLAENQALALNEHFQRQHDALVALTRRQVLQAPDVDIALREITETAARTLNVERVSVWRFPALRDRIRCDALYTLTKGPQPTGVELDQAHHPAYFQALATNEVIAADQARTDPRTSEFAENYLVPLGITAMLDAPILLGGELDGVICHEHVGEARQWRADEQSFAVSVANLISLVLAQAERREVEKQLRQQASLLDQAHDAIMVWDLARRVTYWSRGAARLYGWTADEAVGAAPIDSVTDDPEQFAHATRELLAAGEWAGELQHRTLLGLPITIFARWTLVRDAVGAPESVLAIHTDITERKRLEQQFLRSQRLESIGTLAGGIAHDLNNVLAPIIMSVDLLRMTEIDPERLETLATVETSARRGADMVRQVLTFARGVEGRRTEVQLGDVLSDIRRILDETFLKTITVRVDVKEDLWPVLGDATQVHQVLLNLAVNARDAMPNGGTLTFSAENLQLADVVTPYPRESAPGPYVRVSVEDTGAGMSPEVQDHLFEPFFTTKELGKGTGLGLATARAIAKSHGGFIQVSSELGQGSTFRVYLPASPGGAPAEAVAPAAHLPRGNGELILVVDDEAAVRQITRQALERFGYRVVVASDGTEAVTRYAEQREEISLVLSDMMMPGMDGLATVRLLREMNPDLRVILASGVTGNADLAWALEEGLRHFLPKPFTIELLLTTVRQVLDEAASS